MKFNRLRISGFKSFVDPTEILIEPGLTGIVGPNGCGKSNLLEALRWVMGETSYKTLRGAAMDDVIFSGAADRPARNTAEVTVTLDNSERTAPAQFNNDDVIEVGRRIEREVGSAYRINGREARARDVQMLFADAATGAHSVALVRQGQIGEIIAAKPQARRRILEEAAGISGLHHRRHEAELRLRAAEQNLSRLDDVIGEIETQLQALRRQARQAKRYRRVAADIRKAEALLLHVRWSSAKIAAETATGERRQAQDRSEELTVQAAAATTAETEASERLGPLRQAEAEAAAALQRLRNEDRTLQGEAEHAVERQRDLEARIVQITGDIERERVILADHAAQIEALATEEAEIRRTHASDTDEREQASAAVEEVQAALAAGEAVLAEKMSALVELRGAHTNAEARLRECEARVARLKTAFAGIAPAQPDSAVDPEIPLATLESAVADANSLVSETDEQSSAAAAALAAQRENESEAREAATESHRTLDRLEAEAAALSGIVAADDAAGERLVDRVSVDPGCEMALVAALGDDLEASTMPDAPVRWRELESIAASDGLPDGAEPLGQFVNGPLALARRLAFTGVVVADDGDLLQRTLKPGQRLVSREGDLWRWDGFVARAGAETAASRRLAAGNRLAALRLEIDGAGEIRETTAVALEAARLETAAAAEHDRQAREAWRAASQALDKARTALAEEDRKQRAERERRLAIEQQRERITTDLSESEAALAEARDAQARLAPLADLEAAVEPLRGAVVEARATLTDAEARARTLAHAAQERERRVERIAEEARRWHDRAESAKAQGAALRDRKHEAEATLEAQRDLPTNIAEKRARLADAIAQAEVARKDAADRLAEDETELASRHQRARQLEAALGEAREAHARADARLEAAEERQALVEQAIGDELGCRPDQALAQAELEPDAVLPEIAEVERRLVASREDRERLGAVNLMAEDEAADREQRAGELRTERDDLDKAIKRLRQGIGTLNSEARGRLVDAFETVNGHFQTLFKTLFGGGTAELTMTEADDPMEAGLEVVASPPGKRPQTLTLLSGGEQTLTAFALILAVFKTNPSPICVLDEVDAPLDDANVERFCNLVGTLAHEMSTRFLIITHHPYTMARMDRLFGVTMAERGVSQLVSVDLGTAEGFREAG